MNRAVIETVLRAARKHNVALFKQNDNFSREEKISAIALEIEGSVNDASEASSIAAMLVDFAYSADCAPGILGLPAAPQTGE